MIIAFTGHRPDKLGGYADNPTKARIKDDIKKLLTELKPDKVLSGMALGVDQWAAEVCIELGIPFTACVPFIGQESRWPKSSQETFKKIIEKASDVVIVSEGGYTAGKMQIRNEYMVDNCNILVAVYNGDKSGGTFNCIEYGRKSGKEIRFINGKLESK